MAEKPESAYLVNTSSDPVILKIRGRANYLNCGPVSSFFEKVIAGGTRHVLIDFDQCTGMDSTFLGIIAGAALEMRSQDPSGSLTLCRLGSRNLELIRNLGLHRLVHVETAEGEADFEEDEVQPITTQAREDIANARTILEAHENLVQTDERNAERFQDVLSFLKKQVEDG